MNRPTHRQRGNALFLILIGIALFAALSFAVTQGDRGKGTIASEETLLMAGRMMYWASEAEAFVTRAQMADKVKDWGFCTRQTGTGWVSQCASTNCILFTNSTCNSAKQTQGIAPWRIDAAKWYQGSSATSYAAAPANGQVNLYTLRIAGVGTSAAEVVLFFPLLRDDLCREINRKLGLTDTLPTDTYNYEAYEIPTPAVPEPSVTALSDIGDQVVELAGRTSFCVKRAGGEGGRFIHVVIER
jgi:hypothetical protein